MTDEELVEAVARAICASDFDNYTNVYDLKNNNFRADYLFRARAAIAVIRPAVLEEAAKVADSACIPMCEGSADLIAAAIRALKS